MRFFSKLYLLTIVEEFAFEGVDGMCVDVVGEIGYFLEKVVDFTLELIEQVQVVFSKLQFVVFSNAKDGEDESGDEVEYLVAIYFSSVLENQLVFFDEDEFTVDGLEQPVEVIL